MAPRNRPMEAPKMKYTARLPGMKMYSEQIMMTRTAGMKNLYFERKPYFVFWSRFDSYSYTMPMTNDPKSVNTSKSIGTYPE